MLLQTAIPSLVQELGCLSTDLPVRPSVRSHLWRNKVATSDWAHLGVNWTTFPCSMQIRSIGWNTDWVEYFTPGTHTHTHILTFYRSAIFHCCWN